MKKRIIVIATAFLLITLGVIHYSGTEKELEEKEFYTREDLANIKIQPGRTNIYYMWMQGCSVCATLDKWFEETEKIYNIKIYKFNIASQSELFQEVLQAYDVPPENWGYVPFVFISDEYFIGFNQTIGENMENKIKECLEEKQCINPYDKLQN